MDVGSEGRSGDAWGGNSQREGERAARKKGREKRGGGGVAAEEGVSQPEALTRLNTVLGQQIIGA